MVNEEVDLLVEEDNNIIQTDIDQKTGQDKCPKCGATEISLNMTTGNLICHFCRHEFKPETVEGFNEDISSLEGVSMGSGMNDIAEGSDDLITLKCSSCGAEVVVDTSVSTQSKCHWCRNVLSINNQIPNGAVPDIILPFKITKETASIEIKKFVDARGFYANKKFKEEFKVDSVMGVYFPYAVVDVNASATFEGEAERLTRKYYVKVNDHESARYDADVYKVRRDFDLEIDDLTLETSKDKLNKTNQNKTTNVINAILPFDTENAVKFNSNYMAGFTSEKRDTNIANLEPLVAVQAKDIARFACNDSMKFYNRGAFWKNQDVKIKGSQWKTAYLPVWVYSYQEVTSSKKLLHYVVVNARTNEVMGSVPINMPKLLFVSFIIELFSLFAMVSIDFEYSEIFLTFGVIYFIIMYNKYRNSNARHKHEQETKSSMSNLVSEDNFYKKRTGMSNSKISGMNNNFVSDQSAESKFIDSVISQNPFDSSK